MGSYVNGVYVPAVGETGWGPLVAADMQALGVFNVRSPGYGALGNGSNDDTAEIQAALTAAGVAGGEVYIPAGTYIISAALTIPTGVYVRGAGMVNTVIRSTSATADIFVSTSTTFIGVSNLQVEKRITTTAGAAFNFTSVSDFVLENIRVLATYNGGTFTSCTPGLLKNIVCASAAGGNWHRGFWFQSCISIHWEGCFINGGSTLLGGAQAWIQVDSGCDTFIANHIEAGSSSGGGLCIWLTHTLSPSSFAPRWVRFNGFLVEGSNGTASFAGAQIGIKIDNALSAYFSNGYVASSAIGVAAYAGNDIRFTNCEFINCDQQGAYFDGPDVVHFASCAFSDNSQATTNTYAGLTLTNNSTEVQVTNSYFGDRILGHTPKQKYGIESSSVGTQVEANVFENIATENMHAAGSGTFRSRFSADLSLDDGVDLALGTSAGSIIGTTTAQKLGFFGTAGVARPTVSGSRGGNAALTSALNALASLGLIQDSTTA